MVVLAQLRMVRLECRLTWAHIANQLTTMREVERMREVESEDGSLAALGRSKLTHLAKLKRRELEKECEV